MSALDFRLSPEQLRGLFFAKGPGKRIDCETLFHGCLYIFSRSSDDIQVLVDRAEAAFRSAGVSS